MVSLSVLPAFRKFALSLLAASLLAGSSASAQTLTTLASFNASGETGYYPWGNVLVDSSGVIYGTASSGGPSTTCLDANGCGTLFTWTPPSADHHHSGLRPYVFNGDNGANPFAGVVMGAAGIFFGTTANGGASSNCDTINTFGCGTVFKLDMSSNSLTAIYSFTGGNDGIAPNAALVMDKAGNLYGTTTLGGSSTNCNTGYSVGCGTVFKLDPAGNETVLYTFQGADGKYPRAGLVMDSNGNLYGTTSGGGTYGGGTVFKLDMSTTTLQSLYSFTGDLDGGAPVAGLIVDSTGNLYGTTKGGGVSISPCRRGCGTVFKLDASGHETVLHSFQGTDGWSPEAGLVMDSMGNLYGTTAYGGTSSLGTIFKLDSSGKETTLHSFSGSDGSHPEGGLTLDTAGNAYGTTLQGGTSDGGTLYKIALTTPFSSFGAKLDITSGTPPGFQLTANFTQGTGAAAIDPTTQDMILGAGTYQVTVPAGSFQAQKKSAWAYQGVINGVTLQIKISQAATTSYQVQVDASGIDLTTLTNPVTVSLSIGQNSGTTSVTASF